MDVYNGIIICDCVYRYYKLWMCITILKIVNVQSVIISCGCV